MAKRSAPAAVPQPATAPAAPAQANLSEIKIGQVGTFSGVIGAISSLGPKTLGAWVSYTNAHGGLNGHPVKLIVGDDQGDPGTTMTLTKRMVESDGIVAMVGNVNVFAFAPVEAYTRQKGVPIIGGDSIDPGWATSTNVFPVSTIMQTQVIEGLQTMVNSGSQKIGALYCLEVAKLCSYFVDEAKKSPVGSHIVQTYQVSLVAPTYTSQCLRLKDGGIDTLFLLMDGPGASRAVRDCAAQGYRPKIMLMSIDATADTARDPNLATALIPGATFVPTTPGIAAITKYRQVMATYAPSVNDSGVGSFTWASAELLAVAGRNLSANPTSAQLYAALWQLKRETLGGLTVPLTFSKGSPPQVKPCIFLWGINNGRFVAPNGAKPSC